RVAYITKKKVRSDFPSGKFCAITDLRRSISRAIDARASILHAKYPGLPTPPHSLVIDLVIQEIHKGKTIDENSGKKTVYSRTFDAIRFRLCAAVDHCRGG